jgi:hypothetical protein
VLDGRTGIKALLSPDPTAAGMNPAANPMSKANRIIAAEELT